MAKRMRHVGKDRSEALAALHEAAGDLHKAGGIDKLTMRRFDLLCLTLVEELSPDKLRPCARRRA
jgi:putative transcriptional regulator